MIEVKKISFKNLEPAIRKAYEGDSDLLEKYHIETCQLDEAVQTELSIINRVRCVTKIEVYIVNSGNEIIGYFVTLPNNLYSFAINKNYRNKEVLTELWDSIKTVLNHSFICMLYPNNLRAIKWLKKCGMTEVDGVEDGAITLLYHNKPIKNTN